jgi:hypothetical protein
MTSSFTHQAWMQAMHSYADKWRPQAWLLPLLNDQVTILHTHRGAADKHQNCGLYVLCCPLAVYTLVNRFGPEVSPDMEFIVQTGPYIADWASGQPYQMFHFILCDPARHLHLRLLSLPTETASLILHGQAALGAYLHLADFYT